MTHQPTYTIKFEQPFYLYISRTFGELANVAVHSDINADLYIFLTVSNAQYMNGLVPKIGSICDMSRRKRVNIVKYQHGDAETAMVTKLRFKIE